jgi:hypothetical protein
MDETYSTRGPDLYVVETTLRPARLAVAFSSGASTRVLRRAFRLVGGRWGGRFDVLLCVDPDASLDRLHVAILRAADPDFLLVVDPRLDSYDWATAFRSLDYQPFTTVRFREHMETGGFGWLFRSQPTLPDSQEPSNNVLDVEKEGLTWREAAVSGLIPLHSPLNRLRTRQEASDWTTPVNRSGFALRALPSETKWVLFGDFRDPKVAAVYWSIRALGGRPTWRRRGSIKLRHPPLRIRKNPKLVLFAPFDPEEIVQGTAERWTTEKRTVSVVSDDPTDLLLETADVSFAKQAVPITAHQGFLRFATPVPTLPRGQALRRQLLGVAEHRIRSPDPRDPDGLKLARTQRSRELVAEGMPPSRRRITRNGIADVVDLPVAQLVQIPVVSYRDAVSASFWDAGYQVSSSDKGRYQQRTLALARGLMFLAWLLRQRESSQLLDLFFTYHLSGKPPPEYRRAVTYEELRAALQGLLRSSRSRLRRPLIETADRWLDAWCGHLLERGVLVAGYIVACQECAARAWYPAEAVGQRVVCARCTHNATLPGRARRSFRLNEAFYQFRLHNGEVVTLALAHLRKQASESFLYLAESVLDDGVRPREIDAAALVDGRLAIVEAKSTRKVSTAELSFYRHLAQAARAWKLVFATTATSWDADTLTRIDAMRTPLARQGTTVDALTSSDLLAPHGSAELEFFRRRPPVSEG